MILISVGRVVWLMVPEVKTTVLGSRCRFMIKKAR